MQCLWQMSDASLYDETTKKIDVKHMEELFLFSCFVKCFVPLGPICTSGESDFTQTRKRKVTFSM
jgi:hypothetical protein